ncbi:Na+/H+ antiporter [Fodinicola acaciae]|uniref:Na+/H+ antiporter n=1 Tax=Fodinicola acaciae TaxID=2681555 RepID=UPI001FE6E294|nr:Na+/H+ antiporter [Fodinicola acaciae]
MRTIQLLLVVVGAIAVAAIANRRGMQPSLVVVILAAAVSFVPGLPRFTLPPELILGVVLPPLLYSAALDFSFVSFARNLRPILSLGVALVLVSTFATGLVAWWVVPGLAFAPALVLGAVVAPTDAVAAIAVGKQLSLPKKLMAILTGESLVNDAAALTIFTLTVTAVTGGATAAGGPVGLFAYEVVAGVLVGLAVGGFVIQIRRRLLDSGLETAFGLVVPFAAYLVAEQVHGSGVLAVVAAGFMLGHNETSAGFATRLQGRGVWQSADVLLESFVFAYMGLQTRFVFEDLATAGIDWRDFVLGAAILLLVVILVRPLWVFLTYGNSVLLRRITRRKLPDALPWRYAVVISWSGMRGVVTLAAAAGIPTVIANGQPFPGRALIQALAFVLAIGTLLAQSPTLPMLIRRLRISAPEEQRRQSEAVRKARKIARDATSRALAQAMKHPPEGADPKMMERFASRMRAALAERQRGSDADAVEAAENSTARATMWVVRQELLAAQRKALIRARDERKLDDDVLRRELERLDYEEAAAATSME